MFKSTVYAILLTAFFAISFSLFAQEGETTSSSSSSSSSSSDVDEIKTNPENQYSTADQPEDNYLAKFHALEVIEKLQEDNLDKIYTLNVIKENYKDEQGEWEDDYKKVYEGYKLAMDLYYRRKTIYAAVKLEENKKHINEFYKKVSDVYQEETLKMLDLCADHILELSLKASTASNPNSNAKLFEQIMRLRVAYGQLDDGNKARVKRQYHTSVFHYRVAKSYAIAILEDIKPDTYINKYQKQKADNRNRILSGETTASEVVDKKDDTIKENEANEKPEAY